VPQIVKRLAFLLIALSFTLFGATPQLIKASVTSDSVTLEFSSPLTSLDIKTNTLGSPAKDDTYRQFFDIKSALAIKPAVYKNGSFFKELRVSQFDHEHVRLVALLGKNQKLTIKTDGKKVIFEPSWPKQQASASVKEEPSDEAKPNKESFSDMFKDIRLELERKRPDSDNLADKTALQPVVTHEQDSRKKLIIIDPGHGGKDSGAIGINSRQEKDIVFTVSLILKELLERKGYKAMLTRDGDYFIELQERTRFANHKGADLFVSVHANAVDLRHSDPSKSKGVETFFLSPARSERAKRSAEKENGYGVGTMDGLSKEAFLNLLNRDKIVASNKFAIDIQKYMLANLRSKYRNTVDGGVREAPFWVLVGAQMPAVLVELGYITNPEEAEYFEDAMYRALLAKGIAEGVDSYFENN
jgi:N-acetylmuramoyl-L-alanine amidase